VRPFRYTVPLGWRARPSATGRPDDAIYLREPPDTPRAAILLLRPAPRSRPHLDELEAQITAACADGRVIERTPVVRPPHGQLPTLVSSVVLEVPRPGRGHRERRTFAVLEAESFHLTAVLVAAPAFAFYHERAFLALVETLTPVAEVPKPID
jgi:hypothetical protein